MPFLRSIVTSTPVPVLVVLLAFAARASAQGPWNLTIKPNTTPLTTGSCTPVQLDLQDPAAREAPRNPAGARVSIADFDMTVTGAGVVGRYDGPSSWSACACPTSAGATATLTATYPARALAERARVPGVAFQSSITVPVVAGRSSGVPIGCEVIKTTTVGAGSAAPWTVTITSGASALPIGACTPIRIDLRDTTGKSEPRNPAGQLLSFADFDMTVTASGGSSVVGQADGAMSWSACACQGSTVDAVATITASYPARALADRVRVPGVVFQSSITIPLAAARGTFNPPACVDPTARPTSPVLVPPLSRVTPAVTQTTATTVAGGAAGGAGGAAGGAAAAGAAAGAPAAVGGAAAGDGKGATVGGAAGGVAATSGAGAGDGSAAGGAAASSSASSSGAGAAKGGAVGGEAAAAGSAANGPASSSGGGGSASGGATAAAGSGPGAAAAAGAAGAVRSPGALLADTRALQQRVAAEVAQSAAAVQAFSNSLGAADRQEMQSVCAALAANANDEQAKRRFEQIMARHKNQNPDAIVQFCLDTSYKRLQGEMQTSVQALESRSNNLSGDALLTVQDAVQRQQQTAQMLSNLSKTLHDTMMSVLQNIRG